MGKIAHYILIVGIVLALGIFFIYKLTAKTWVYDLPNNYKVRQTSDMNVTVGVEVDGDYYTAYEDKKVGIDDYVAEFQYNKQYVGVKALSIENGETVIKFYFIDTKEREVHGPYYDEESYLAAIGVWSKEVLDEWITTTKTPDGAYFK